MTATCTIMFDRLAVFPVPLANQDHASNLDFCGAQRGQRQQCVIDGAERSPGNQQEQAVSAASSDAPSAAAHLWGRALLPRLRQSGFSVCDSRQANLSQFDADSGAPCGQMRRHRRSETIGSGSVRSLGN